MVVAAGFNAVWGRIVGQPAALNLDKAREGLAGSWTCDTSLAERDLGWKTAAPLEQRIFETIAWCRAQGWVK
jgi:nucleoside-diphosphate-sugar epimerase